MKKSLIVLVLMLSVPIACLAADLIPMQSAVDSQDVSIINYEEACIRMTIDKNAVDSSYGEFTSGTYDLGDYSRAILDINISKITNGSIDTTNNGDTLLMEIKTAHDRNTSSTICTLFVDTIIAAEQVTIYLGSGDAFQGLDSLLENVWIDYYLWDSASDAASDGALRDYYIRQEIQPKR